jgi:hypothetical protein
MEVSDQLRAHAALPPGETLTRYQFYRTLGGPQSRFGRYGEEKKFASVGNRNLAPHRLAHSLIATLTEVAPL